MSDKFIKHLNSLSEIQPDPDFLVRTRALILETPKSRVAETRVRFLDLFRIPKFSYSVAALALSIVLVGYIGASGSIEERVSVTALDSSKLSQELDTLRIDLKIDKVTYNQKIQETVAMAVSEISTKQVQYPSPILDTENSGVPARLLDKNEQIDSLLKDIIF